MKIALDAMGGDYGPSIIVEGISEVSRDAEVEIILVGDSERIERELKDQNLEGRPISVLHAESHVDMHESPKRALRDKTSSIFLAVQLVKDGKADAVISAGNTGAMLALSLFVFFGIPPIRTPPSQADAFSSTQEPTWIVAPTIFCNLPLWEVCMPKMRCESRILGWVF